MPRRVSRVLPRSMTPQDGVIPASVRSAREPGAEAA